MVRNGLRYWIIVITSLVYSNENQLFNKDQSLFYARIKDTVPDPVSKLTTVIYGHDAKTGLAIRPYTKGLDSNCVKGGKLSALVVEGGGEQTLVQVKCRDHTA